MQVGAKIALFRLPLNRRDNLVAHHQATNIPSLRFLNVFLNQNMGVQAAKSVNHTFCRLPCFGKDHANPLCPFYQFYHQRRAADHGNQITGVIR